MTTCVGLRYGQLHHILEDFLGSLIRVTITLAEAAVYFQFSASLADLPTKPIPTTLNALFRQCADLSLLRPPFAHAAGTGILTGCPSNTPFGFSLGPD